jgi:octaprenyl-diphosphate synthase
VAWLNEQVRAHGGMSYAEEKMSFFKDQALQILLEFPNAPARAALEVLVDYTTDRPY